MSRRENILRILISWLRMGTLVMAAKDKEGSGVGPTNSPANASVPLPPELQGQLGNRLREAYSDLVNQPVPDKFLTLLEQLKTSEKTGGKS